MTVPSKKSTGLYKINNRWIPFCCFCFSVPGIVRTCSLLHWETWITWTMLMLFITPVLILVWQVKTPAEKKVKCNTQIYLICTDWKLWTALTEIYWCTPANETQIPCVFHTSVNLLHADLLYYNACYTKTLSSMELVLWVHMFLWGTWGGSDPVQIEMIMGALIQAHVHKDGSVFN